ncbi:calcium-translocating P-type ATPase, SERCA-type [Desulfotomaculum copahuensis]|uniref:P-type Ca(2+) transporter n=1 Tax=Desulfotomaculum copahuensis TaxID=1838280 RepID=A0A1B7LEA9_9FIRM|nr:calcium-translocating P-type ATPase, SERCA-type [Desulfotomaculum copahuensis]OAT81431.1 calcium-translocating P-type ATPase, SERCA-type [Desulfotomaculum copahuensis]
MAEQWYSLSGEEVAAVLNADAARGLTDREAKERAARFGPNQLARAPRVPLWRLFLDQFSDFMVLVLLAATVISGFLGEYADAVTIMIIVLVNAVLGCVQEFRAERSMEALKELTAPEARVIRNRMEGRIPAAELVPGDIVLLETGDRVPADLRLVQTVNLEVEESALTGESAPVKKHTAVIPGPVTPGDARNMAFLGTVITRGRGRGLVVATGMATEMGRIAGLIQEAGTEETPLQRRLAQLGKGLVAFCLAVCALVVVIGIYRGEPAYQMFLAGVSLAVAAIPEGLPAIVTVALAIGVQRMIRRQAIIRKLPAVETLGCATVICSDKTGTLTKNEMTVRRALIGGHEAEIGGEGYDPKGEIASTLSCQSFEYQIFFRIAALCNNAVLTRGETPIGGLFRGLVPRRVKTWDINGDPTEGALLVMAAKAGFWREELERREQRMAEFPFDAERKRMTVVYRQADGKLHAYVKGAPDVVLELCSHCLRNGRVVPLTARERAEILKQNAALAGRALRVLALAWRELPGGSGEVDEDRVEQSLIFAGLAGMIDPPRPSALAAVQRCRRAGIRVVMITGDHRLTAAAVAGELGILGRGENILGGAELDAMNDDELCRAAGDVPVYARVSPRHKLRIVRALKQGGQVVAMTGDGVNDAPAVKEADIGIAMGITGTDVTREASAMVLADDNFATIVAAVEEGRGIYDNIRKFIRYLLSCNVGEVLVMLLAVLAGLPLPLLPIQILWMNLVTDGLPAMALGVDPADRDIMFRRPRHPQESVFAHGLAWRILGSGAVIGLGTLLVFAWGLYGGSGNLTLARTMAFNTLVFSQLFFVFTCRSEKHTILEVGLFSNRHLLLAAGLSAVLQMAVNYIPRLQTVFHTAPLTGLQWSIIAGVALAPPLAGTLLKQLQLRVKEKISYLKV